MFFVVIGIIADVKILGLTIWRPKKAFKVSAPLCAAKVLGKATQKDAYIEHARTQSTPPNSLARLPVSQLHHVPETAATSLLSPGCNALLHHTGLLHNDQTYPQQPVPINPGNSSGVGHADGFVLAHRGQQDTNITATTS